MNTARIYKMINSIDNTFYIGSTKNTLQKRFYNHKYDSKRIYMYVYEHYNTIGWNTVSIELIEEFQYNDKKDILKKENHYIMENYDNPLCLNTKKAYIDHEAEKARRKDELRKRFANFRQERAGLNYKVPEYTKTYKVIDGIVHSEKIAK
jgi:hypothetical protein